MNDAYDVHGLERRLALGYLGAFTVVLAVFALAVHLAFVFDIDRDVSERLAVLLAQGRLAVTTHHGKREIEPEDVRVIDLQLESVVWQSRGGRPLARVGNVVDRDAASGTDRLGDTTVAVTTSRAADLRALARVDTGLAVGMVVSLILAGIGGRYFALQAIRRVVATMRTLRDFTADAAHELRGPLAAIGGNADASRRDAGDLPPAHRRRLETIAGTVRSMASTVEDLLLIARAERPLSRDLYAIGLEERVRQAVDARRAMAAAKNVALGLHVCDRARIYGDPAEIDRVLGNLIDNAVRFTPPGGSVDVACAPERSGFAVRVRDNGVGIAPEDLTRIFERFWRSDAVRGRDTGSGLGLAIVRALVRRHGGDISVRSVPSAGSEFVVWLPHRPPAAGLHEIST